MRDELCIYSRGKGTVWVEDELHCMTLLWTCCLASCDVHVSMLTLLFEQTRPLSYGFVILVSRYQLLRQVTPDDTSGEKL